MGGRQKGEIILRYLYHLYRYGSEHPINVGTFNSRRALSAYMKLLSFTPSELADKFFLQLVTPKYFAVYDLVSPDSLHLRAVLCHKVRRFCHD